jgi:two-component system response regulator HydG
MIEKMNEKGSILVVDDDNDMTTTLSDILVDLHYHVETANNGFEAIEKIKNRRFDTILLDIKMPGISGVETFKEIKKIRPDAVVMLMTAQSVEQLVTEALDQGAFGIMYKPIDTTKLIGFMETTKTGALLLFVDVDLSATLSLMGILKERGYRIAKARSGKEAIKVVTDSDVDLVFIAIKMPVMNGLETYMFLKHVKPGIKVVMTTNYREGLDDLIEQALDESAYACIYKPFELENVVTLLKRILEGKTKKDIEQLEKEDEQKRLKS